MLTLVPEPRKRLVPALSSMGRKPEVQHHATRLVVDDYGDAVAVQKRCSSCMRWHSTYERGWCLDCKVFSERARRHRLDEGARAALRERRRLQRLERMARDPAERERERRRNDRNREARIRRDPEHERELARARSLRYLERVRQDPERYQERLANMRVDNVLRRMDAGLATGFGRRLKGTSPEWERKYVPSAPLALAVLGQARMTPTELANAAGIDGKVLRNWRTGEQRRATWGSADAVLVALDRFWWEVFDPQDGPHGAFSGVRSRDIVAWIAAAEAAIALWEPDEADGEAVEWLAMAGAL